MTVGPSETFGRLTIRLADPTDAGDLAPRLRAWDMVECLATGLDPMTALTAPFWKGFGPYTRAVELDGKLIGMGGVTLQQVGLPLIWYLGAPETEAAGGDFVRLGRSVHERALRQFGPLQNIVAERSTASIRFLRAIGFDILPEFVHLRSIRFLRFRSKAG